MFDCFSNTVLGMFILVYKHALTDPATNYLPVTPPALLYHVIDVMSRGTQPLPTLSRGVQSVKPNEM